jgi:tight adherence protein B
VRAGTAPPAVEHVVESICLALDRGQPLADALRPTGLESPHLDVVLTVLRACARHGGPAAEPLDRAAATLRARAADHADRLTHSAQARMSAVVMTCLPVAMLGLMLLTSASVRVAVGSPVGLLAVGVGAVLNAIGWLWMRRTIGRDAT